MVRRDGAPKTDIAPDNDRFEQDLQLMMRVASSVGELSNARTTFTLQKNRPMNWEIRVVPKPTALDWAADLFHRRFSSMLEVMRRARHDRFAAVAMTVRERGAIEWRVRRLADEAKHGLFTIKSCDELGCGLYVNAYRGRDGLTFEADAIRPSSCMRPVFIHHRHIVARSQGALHVLTAVAGDYLWSGSSNDAWRFLSAQALSTGARLRQVRGA